MANIMRFISFEITNQSLKDMELDVAVKNSILTPKSTELYINQIKSKMIDVNSSVQCVVLKFNESSDELINKIIFTLKPSLAYNFKNVILLSVFEKPVLVAVNTSKEMMVEILAFCDKEIVRNTKQKVGFCVGKIEIGFENLHKSYNLANKISKINSQNNVVFYDELGIYKLLAQIEDRQILDDFINDTLRAIIDYDTLNKGDLCYILRKYLEHNGSVKVVADELFLHRNTVNYKLNKISELLDCNLSLQKNRTELALAFAIIDFF